MNSAASRTKTVTEIGLVALRCDLAAWDKPSRATWRVSGAELLARWKGRETRSPSLQLSPQGRERTIGRGATNRDMQTPHTTADRAPSPWGETDISSLIDTWLLLRDIELNGERNRGLYVLKSRGMAHSNQIREFLLTRRGIELKDVYIGPGGVLTGSARLAQEAQEQAARVVEAQEIEVRQRELERKRLALAAQVAALNAGFAAEEAEVRKGIGELQQREERLQQNRLALAASRMANGTEAAKRPAKPE